MNYDKHEQCLLKVNTINIDLLSNVCYISNEEIKIAIDHSGGDEVDEYWDWINEIKPHLPNGFLKSFKRNGRRAVAEAMARSIADDDDGDGDGDDVDNGDSNDEPNKKQGVATFDGDGKGEELKFTSPHQFHNKDVTESKTCTVSQ